jgi:hypothetical protein
VVVQASPDVPDCEAQDYVDRIGFSLVTRMPQPGDAAEGACSPTLAVPITQALKESLGLARPVLGSSEPDSLYGLSDLALRIAINKPIAWESQLFGQVYADEIERTRAINYGARSSVIPVQGVRLIEARQFIDWTLARLEDLQDCVTSSKKIVDEELAEAMGPPGEDASAAGLIRAARRLGEVYRRVLKWDTDWRQIEVGGDFTAVHAVFLRASAGVITELERFSHSIQEGMRSAISRYERTKEPQSIAFELKFTGQDLEEMSSELDRLANRLRLKH